MVPQPQSPQLLATLIALDGLPLLGGRGEGIQSIVELCRSTFDAELCNLIALGDGRIYQLASASRISSNSRNWDEKLLKPQFDPSTLLDHQFVELYGLQSSGQGVANERVARRYGFDRVIAVPLRYGDSERGYLSCFKAGCSLFSDAERSLLSIFSRQVIISMERARYASLADALRFLADTSAELSRLSPSQFLGKVATGSRKLLNASTCVLWEFNDEKKLFRVIAATDDIDDEYRTRVLDPSDHRMNLKLEEGQVTQIEDVQAAGASYIGAEDARRFGWVSLLSTPVHVTGDLRGLLDLYTSKKRVFRDWEKAALQVYAHQTAIVLQVEERRVVELDRILNDISTSSSEDTLFRTTLRHAIGLSGADRGWIGKINVEDGSLNGITDQGVVLTIADPQGAVRDAITTGRPVRISYLSGSAVVGQGDSDTHSQLVVPLVIQNAEIRQGSTIGRAPKQIGIITVESRNIGAFSNIDQARLSTLAREAAVSYERLETDRKFRQISQTETEIMSRDLGYEDTIRYVAKAITRTLGFTFVNISLVDENAERIRTFHVEGLNETDAVAFRQMADHSLHSEAADIQADIATRRQIEVPEADDQRFDKKIHERFGLQNLIRVFVPMIIPSGNQVVGTVEAGYLRANRPFIFERDVRALVDFVAFVAEALEHRRVEVLDGIMHELRAPVSAIRSNVAFLDSHGSSLAADKYYRKLNDLALDIELALLQVSNLERYLGGPAPSSSQERVNIYRDIIIKTVLQFKPRLIAQGFDISKVTYLPEDRQRLKNYLKISLFLDSAKLQQVVFNLFFNAIKYAEPDKSHFQLQIALLDYPLQYILSFKDWGIGIKPDYRTRVFEKGFRTPEAIARSVPGSGLGLSIAKDIMRELGGDLRLMPGQKPTEFQIVLPKTLEKE